MTNKATYACGKLPSLKEFHVKFRHLEMPTVEFEHVDLFIPEEVLAGKKLTDGGLVVIFHFQSV